MFCGISVVDGREWEALKRYNVNSLYLMPRAGSTDEAGGSARERDERACAESAA